MQPAGGGQRPWWEQFKATVKRNITIKMRQKRRTAGEIFMPIYIFAILAIVRAVQPETHFAEVTSPHGSANITDGQLVAAFSLYVVPNEQQHQDFADRLRTLLNQQGLSPNITLLASEADLEALTNNQSVTAGLVLPADPGHNLTYTLRLDPRLGLPTTMWDGDGSCRGGAAGGPLDGGCAANRFYYSGFLTLQNSVDALLIQNQVGSTSPSLTSMKLQDGPKAAASSGSSEFLKIFVPLYMVISLSQFITYLLVLIVGEKEAKIKDGLKQMGLRDSVYWLSWFLLYAVYVFVVASICIVIMYVSKVFPHSDNIYIYIIYVLYGWSLVMFGFMLTPFFHKAKVAGGVGNLAVTVLSLLFLIQVFIDTLPPPFFWVLSLISPVAFTFGIERAVDLDTTKVGLHSDNLWDSAGGMPFGGAIIMIVVDIFLYAFLAFYLDNVIPNEYGRRESPLFIFKKSYWFKSDRALLLGEEQDQSYVSVDQEATNPDVEPVSSEVRGKVALRLYALRKEFTSNNEKIVAVNDLSLDMYEGQITAILGHNGAGKTTLFNMLTGLMQPTSGTATIYGLDITNPGDMRELWSMTGICPQHDILVEDMSPREHLVFLAGLRGVSPERMEAEVASTLAEVDLTEKADEPVRGLSGGQKRKLSVGQALIGDPRIIVLDEPTAGVDPYSRRRLWSLLQRRKQGRLVLLSTHFMDEADILADRKAIVSTGRLRCCGSSMFLKSRFGLGYHLTIVADENMSAEAVGTMIDSHIPEKETGRVHGHEHTYVLPMNSVSQFPGLFSDLEVRQKELAIQSFGISLTTLEEVFLHLASAVETDEPRAGELASVTRGVLERTCSIGSGERDVSNGESIVLEERGATKALGTMPQMECRPQLSATIAALLRVRLTNLWRVPGTFIFIVCIPVALMVGGLMINRGSSGGSADRSSSLLLLNRHTYPSYQLMLYHNNTGGDIDSLIDGWDFDVKQFNGSFTAMLRRGGSLASVVLDSAAQLTATIRDQATHSAAVLLNAINNGRLNAALTPPDPDSRLKVYSHPLPLTNNDYAFDANIFSSAFMVGFLFLLVPISIAAELVQERELRIRNALRVNGLSFTTYFLSFFIVMFVLFVILWVVMLIVVKAGDVSLLSNGPAFSMLAVLYLEYTVVGLLSASVVSYMFDKLDTCVSVYPNIATLCGMLPYMLVSLLDMLVSNGTGDIANPVHYVLCIIDPFYIPCGALYFLSKRYVMVRLLEGRAPDYGDYWGEPVFIVPVVVMLVQIPLFWWLLRLVDARKQGHSTASCLPIKGGRTAAAEDGVLDSAPEDSDVLAEQERVQQIMAGRYQGPTPAIAAQDLNKTYPAKKKSKGAAGVLRAVSGVSFAVDTGEVFGLLGPNGAGKTTTMRMVIAEEAPSSGQIEVGGKRVTDSLSEAFHLLGYCPQFDAQWKYITVEEHLRCFAKIRGLSPQDVDRVTNHYIEGLEIREHASKRSMLCSGGTKRKLSYALSMLGAPRLVLLDEPSTGMDPQSKRFLWDTIAAGFRGDRGAILTTHSMEEADALCNRLAIMVRGRLRCLGSTQHLKNKYGGGYVLEIKLIIDGQVDSRMEKVKQLVREMFSTSEIEEEFGERIRYRIPQQDITCLSHGFSTLETAKSELGMEEYSLSQTTLEQVFLRFAKEQEMEE